MTTVAAAGGDVLRAIVAGARASAEARERQVPLDVMEREAMTRAPRGDAFRASLAADGVRVIAECKRRSPSRGILRAAYAPDVIARGYTAAGAAGISVLTEPSFFDGSLEHLRAAGAAVETPLLRKDFIVTPYQIAEARACGADAVLLIVAALDDAELRRLLAYAESLALMTLVETHTDVEVARAVDAGATVIGVNSRSLKTLEVDTTLFERLAETLPTGVVKVAESGIRTPADVRRVRAAGYSACLIGERFMTEPDPGTALAAFVAQATEAGV